MNRVLETNETKNTLCPHKNSDFAISNLREHKSTSGGQQPYNLFHFEGTKVDSWEKKQNLKPDQVEQ
jgi:hypothetical protein